MAKGFRVRFIWAIAFAKYTNKVPYNRLVNVAKMPCKRQVDKEGLPNGRNFFPNGRKWPPKEMGQ
jgi:hypothetical protein